MLFNVTLVIIVGFVTLLGCQQVQVQVMVAIVILAGLHCRL